MEEEIFARILCKKINKMLEFYVKINKIPEFNIARKIPEFYVIIARRKYFPDFFMGGGALIPCLLRLCGKHCGCGWTAVANAVARILNHNPRTQNLRIRTSLISSSLARRSDQASCVVDVLSPLMCVSIAWI